MDKVIKVMQLNPQVINAQSGKHSSGRNVGFRNGRGDIFLVIDGHCQIMTDQLLKNVVDCFERSGAHCLGRPQPLIIPKEPNMQKAIALARGSWLGHSFNSFIHSGNEGFVSPVSVGCAYRKEIFEKVGFVDETFDACEDVDSTISSWFQDFFSPTIAVHYYAEATYQTFGDNNRYGRGRFNFMYKHPAAIHIETLLPAILVLGILLSRYSCSSRVMS
jgi:GT2 family glycosyltransferase